jgi:hypothetical protein
VFVRHFYILSLHFKEIELLDLHRYQSYFSIQFMLFRDQVKPIQIDLAFLKQLPSIDKTNLGSLKALIFIAYKDACCLLSC